MRSSSEQISARGHSVNAIALRPGRLVEEFRCKQIPVTELSMGSMLSFGTVFRLLGLLKRQRPHVVHTHLGRADSYGRLAARLAGVPVIVTTAHNVERWKDNIAFRSIDAFTSQFAHRTIACSERVREHLRAVGTVPMNKVTVIRNGINLGIWDRSPNPATTIEFRKSFNFAEQDFVIGIVGRLEEQKGHVYLFEALASLRDEFSNLRLLVVGEGTLGDSLRQLVNSLKLSPNVTFAGARRDMRIVYEALNLVVIPSLWEGLPITLLEAMASGRAVVATNVGGIPEVIRHEFNGLLLPPKDSVAIADAIKRCYCDRDLMSRLALAGKNTVHMEFSIEVTARKVIEVYEELMERGRLSADSQPTARTARVDRRGD
jgi:glycosyltransferase involved in cell wall biosynthesis